MEKPSKFPKVLFAVWFLAAVALVGAYGAMTLKGGEQADKPVAAGPAAKSPRPAQPDMAVQAGMPGPVASKEVPTVIPLFDPKASEYVLLAWSESGLYLVSDGDDMFSLAPPGGTLRAQLVKRGETPEIISNGSTGTTLSYAVEPGFERPSRNSRYWEFSETLAGRRIEPDTGLTGNRPQGVMQADEASKTFVAQSLPILPYTDEPAFMPYPMVTVEAHDADGQLLAATRAVLPVSTELGCKNCHGGGWKIGSAGLSDTTAASILAVHDRRSGTTLQSEARSGKPRACTSCHAENRTEEPSDEPAMENVPKLLGLSASIHGFHANLMTGKGAEACSACHPATAGSATRSMRGVHAAKGLDCSRCHGFLEDHALGLLKGEAQAGKAGAAKLAAGLKPRLLPDAGPRTPWIMEPDCTGCHDFASKPDQRLASAAGKWTTGRDGLYHARKDEVGAMACPACHGSAHAEYPASNPYGKDRDNIQPVQYQSLAGPIGAANNCSVCHTIDLDVSASIHHSIPVRPAIKISVPEGAELGRKRVMFPHQAHEGTPGLDCRTCHHKGHIQAKGQACSSAGCHDRKNPQTAEERSDPLYFRNAFHGRDFSCNACHQALRKAGKPAGPVECAACHTAS